MAIRARACAVAAFATMAIAGSAQAQSYSFLFPTATSSVTASVGFITASEVGYFWSQARGDRVSQTYSSSGLFNANQLELDINVTQNVLSSGAQVDWDVLVNGVDVGDWSWSDAMGTGLTHLSLSFAPIAGEFSSLALVVTNEVPPGFGSIALGIDSAGSVSAIPEPETYAMLLVGLGLLGFEARRRKKLERAAA